MRAILFLALFLPGLGNAAEADLFQDLFAAPARPTANRVSYEGQGYSPEHVRGTSSSLSLQKHRLRISRRLRADPSFLSIEANAELERSHTRARFPGSRNTLPNELWNVSIGANYRKPLERERSLGASVTIGSPSDRPFASIRETSLSANLTYRVPASTPRDQWLFFVNESNTRGFLRWVPLPGFGYLFDRDETFKLFLGVPVVGFFWMPSRTWMVNAFYFPVQSGQFQVSHFVDYARFYAGFRSAENVYLRAGRDDVRDRLFSSETDVHFGAAAPLSRVLSADLCTRYVFRRYYYEGKNFADRKTARRLDMDPSLSATLKLVGSF